MRLWTPTSLPPSSAPSVRSFALLSQGLAWSSPGGHTHWSIHAWMSYLRRPGASPGRRGGSKVLVVARTSEDTDRAPDARRSAPLAMAKKSAVSRSSAQRRAFAAPKLLPHRSETAASCRHILTASLWPIIRPSTTPCMKAPCMYTTASPKEHRLNGLRQQAAIHRSHREQCSACGDATVS